MNPIKAQLSNIVFVAMLVWAAYIFLHHPDRGPPPGVKPIHTMNEVQQALKAKRYGDAQVLLQSMADDGNVAAMTQLADLDIHMFGGYAHALGLLRMAAEKGDAMSCTALGDMYLRGKGVAKDAVRAYVWWHLAAERLEKTGAKSLAQDYAARSDALRSKMTPQDGALADSLMKDADAGQWKELEK
jgi:TPR repeat protein